MFELLKKNSMKYALTLSACTLIVGGLFLLFNIDKTNFSLTGYTDFATLSPDKIRNQTVSVELQETFGCYMEAGSRDRITKYETISAYYYLIRTGTADNTEKGYKYMSIKVPAVYQNRMDALMENTPGNLSTNPLSFSGKIRKLSSTEQAYFNSFFEEFGFTKADIAEMTLPYYIDAESDLNTSSSFRSFLYCVVGIIFLIVSVVNMAVFACGGYLHAFRKDIAQSDYAESYVEADFNTAATYNHTMTGSIRIGKLFTYYGLNGCRPRAIPNKIMLRAYWNATNQRINGIKVATFYNVIILAEGHKHPFKIPVGNEDMVFNILRQLKLTCPWIELGND